MHIFTYIDKDATIYEKAKALGVATSQQQHQNTGLDSILEIQKYSIDGSFYNSRDTVQKGHMVNTQNQTYTPIDPNSKYGQNYFGQQNTAGDMKLRIDPRKGKPPKKRLTFKKPFDPNK